MSLLPCPFCGSRFPAKAEGRPHVFCQRCNARGPSGFSNHPEDDWNDRDTARQRDELLAALKAIRDDSQCGIDLYEKNGPQWTSRETGAEYYDASYVLQSKRDVVEACDKAIAAAGGGK